MNVFNKGLINLFWTLFHCVVIEVVAFGIFCLQHAFGKKTGSFTGGLLPCPIYEYNVPMCIIGFILFCVGYSFAWKYWLKKDLQKSRECHWGWCVVFWVIAVISILCMIMNVSFATIAGTSSFASYSGLGNRLIAFQFAYLVVFPIAEYLIIRKKQGEK